MKTYVERLTSENVERILGDGWDVIVDGTDNFPTRYLVNDAAVWHGIPLVHGSIYRFEGQVTSSTRRTARRPVLPLPLPACRRRRSSRRRARRAACSACCRASSARSRRARRSSSCLGVGETLAGRLLLFDALVTEFSEVKLKKDPACPVCGEHPTITEYVDYVEFCAGTGAHA